mgnify:CR=1 FL=1
MNLEQERLNMLKELLQRLNGKCSKKKETCPMYVFKYNTSNWTCNTCIDLFISLDKKALAKVRSRTNRWRTNPCPCSLLPYEVIEARIFELIELYEEALR